MPHTDPPTGAPRRLITRALARVMGSLVALLVLYYLLPLQGGSGTHTVTWLTAGLFAFAAVSALHVRAILHAPYPALRAITGFGTALPVFILVFASTYLSMSAANPNAFSESLSHTDALYFAMTIFSTVGFGDITPQNEVARIATTIQMTAGLLVLGLLARVVIGAVQETRQRQQQSNSTQGQG